ncbi:MAG: hypothetical protein IJA34_03010 [Lachnospiraceae bacterium]|nr:hypothetical protein [Lachnospiraceae bacterium]
MSESTKEILNKIESANTWEELGDILRGLEKITFGDRLSQLCIKYQIKPSKLQLEVAVSKTMFYDVMNGTRKPSKETVIKIALVMKITEEELNELLKLAGHKELYPKKKEDAIIIFGLKNKKDIVEIDELLKEYGSKIRIKEQ